MLVTRTLNGSSEPPPRIMRRRIRQTGRGRRIEQIGRQLHKPPTLADVPVCKPDRPRVNLREEGFSLLCLYHLVDLGAVHLPDFHRERLRPARKELVVQPVGERCANRRRLGMRGAFLGGRGARRGGLRRAAFQNVALLLGIDRIRNQSGVPQSLEIAELFFERLRAGGGCRCDERDKDDRRQQEVASHASPLAASFQRSMAGSAAGKYTSRSTGSRS
jgi:hypothetical protein